VGGVRDRTSPDKTFLLEVHHDLPGGRLRHPEETLVDVHGSWAQYGIINVLEESRSVLQGK